MRKALATLVLIALALPAAAQEDTQIVEISHNYLESSTGPILFHKVESRSGNLEDIATAINGYFLWIQYGDGETVSVDVSDVTITRAVVSLDGTVTLVRAAPVSEPTPETPEPAVETVDLTVEYPDTVVVQVFGIRAE